MTNNQAAIINRFGVWLIGIWGFIRSIRVIRLIRTIL